MPSINKAGSTVALLLISFLCLGILQNSFAQDREVENADVNVPVEETKTVKKKPNAFIRCLANMFKRKAKKPEYKGHGEISHIDYQIKVRDNAGHIDAAYKIVAIKGQKHTVLFAPFVLTEANYKKKQFKLIKHKDFYEIECLEDGTFELALRYLIPVQQNNNINSMSFKRPESFSHSVDFELMNANVDLYSPTALYYKNTTLNDRQQVRAMFVSQKDAEFIWQPKQRELKNEAPGYLVENHTLAVAGAGSIDLEQRITLEITRGQIKNMTLMIPDKQSVTSVSVDGLYNWAFDPQSKRLELQFAKAISGKRVISLNTQIKVDSQPYSESIKLASVMGADRERGQLAMVSGNRTRLQIDKTEHFFQIDNQDFSFAAFKLAQKTIKDRDIQVFSYRYLNKNAELNLTSSKVIPQLESIVEAVCTVIDERIILSAKMQINITKSSVFSVNLTIPNGFEVESVKVAGMSHWDELNLDGQRQLAVYFKKPLSGAIPVQVILLKKLDEEAESELSIGSIAVRGEKRQRGKLTVQNERGQRLEMMSQKGLGRQEQHNDNLMSFRIQKKDWTLTLKRTVLNPRVEAEYIQLLKFSETMVRGRLNIHYNIEDAGVKRFVIQAPEYINSLDVAGKDIAQVSRQDDNTWLVELKHKVYNRYLLNVQFQYYLRDGIDISADSFKLLNSDRQRGYLCLFNAGAFELTVDSKHENLQPFESRIIPALFHVEELSKSSYAFRIKGQDFSLKLKTTHYKAADLLPAKVKSVNIRTIVSLNGNLLNQVTMQLISGNKQYLKMKLPPGSKLMSIYIADTAVQASIENEHILIPVPQAIAANEDINIQIYYSTKPVKKTGSQYSYKGPSFDLPLQNVNWYLYLPHYMEFHKYGGSMNYVNHDPVYYWQETEGYLHASQADKEELILKAKSLIEESSKLSQFGKRKVARENLETAVMLSNGQKDLNEDARIQLKSAWRQQTLIGLLNRRANLHAYVSSDSLDQLGKLCLDKENFNNGQFTDAFATAIESALKLEERVSMSRIAERIYTQQKSAVAPVLPIRVKLPDQGQEIHYHTDLMIEPMAEMQVNFQLKEINEPVNDYKMEKRYGFFALCFIIAFCFTGFSLRSFKFITLNKKSVKAQGE